MYEHALKYQNQNLNRDKTKMRLNVFWMGLSSLFMNETPSDNDTKVYNIQRMVSLFYGHQPQKAMNMSIPSFIILMNTMVLKYGNVEIWLIFASKT